MIRGVIDAAGKDHYYLESVTEKQIINEENRK